MRRERRARVLSLGGGFGGNRVRRKMGGRAEMARWFCLMLPPHFRSSHERHPYIHFLCLLLDVSLCPAYRKSRSKCSRNYALITTQLNPHSHALHEIGALPQNLVPIRTCLILNFTIRDSTGWRPPPASGPYNSGWRTD